MKYKYLLVSIICGLLLCCACSAERDIVFSDDRDGNSEIYVMTSNGKSIKRLTFNDFTDRSPKWSPDGSMIAYVSYPSDISKITVMNSDGSDINFIADGYDPAWSPDGNKIAFVHSQQDHGGIFVVNRDGSNLTQISEGAISPGLRCYHRSPAWSPDGSYIVINNGCTSQNLALMNPDGSNFQLLTNEGSAAIENPTWSPDGKWIAFSCKSISWDLCMVEVNKPELIIRLPIGNQTDEYSPSFSPDGTEIVYRQEGDIKIINILNNQLTELTSGSSPDWKK